MMDVRFPEYAKGLRVAHKFGGEGTVVEYADFPLKDHRIVVIWDRSDQHPLRVPSASLAMVDGSSFLEAYSKFSARASLYVRVCRMLDEGAIQESDRLYELQCAGWWDRADFYQKRSVAELEDGKRQAEDRRIRERNLTGDIEEVLRQGRFEAADLLYGEQCSAFWEASAYAALRDRYVAEHEAAAARRIRKQQRQRQEEIRSQVVAMLQRLDIDAADRAYERCKDWWPTAEYQLVRSVAEAGLLEKTRRGLRGDVLARLKQGDIGEADALYESDCSTWWTSTDYHRYRCRAVASHALVSRYAADALVLVDGLLTDEHLHLTLGEMAHLKQLKINIRLARFGLGLDEEQQLACARPDRNLLVCARAGSGKTRTLTAIAALAIDDEQLDPDQVLVLAFNTKAAKEIGDRIRMTAGAAEYLNARTFHSLAYHLVGAKRRELIFNDGEGDPSRRKQSQFVQRTLRGILNPAFKEQLYEFFRRELEQIERAGADLSEAEHFAYRRSLELVALNGDRVKSNGEKFIADFLFEHGIPYKYERMFSWERKDHLNGAPYRPDFCINATGRDFIVEHWAIDPDDAAAEVPTWWDTDTERYRRQIVEKREYWRARDTLLIETHTGMMRGGREAFEAALGRLLEQAGIPCVKLDHAELVRRVAENPDSISRMAELFLSFIQRAKKRGWTVERMGRRLAERPDPEPRNRVFHQLALRAYGEYERLLDVDKAMDYDDLLAMAGDEVAANGGAATIALSRDKVVAIRELRWILLDEFQDFSELYFRLIAGIQKANPDIRLVAVGDDWQAINSFAGAQLKFFENFAEYFPRAGRVGISKNYRSSGMIVGAGNRIMAERGTPALASKPTMEGATIDVRAIDKCFVDFRAAKEHEETRERDALYFVGTPFASGQPQAKGPSVTQQQAARALKTCVEFIVDSAWRDAEGKLWLPRVLVLGRSRFAYGLELPELERRLRRILQRHPALAELSDEMQLDVMTAHKAKGKEADTVIVLDVTAQQFPKIHADNVLFQPFGVTVSETLSEERRLFYVAVTRAEHRLLLLTETGRMSPFIEELKLERGLADLEELARSRPANVEPTPMSELGEEIRSRIAAIDRWELVEGNASPDSSPILRRMRARQYPPPKVEHCIQGASGAIHAEFAWPDLQQPVAILTRLQAVHAGQWRDAGWNVLLAK